VTGAICLDSGGPDTCLALAIAWLTDGLADLRK
jgi:hypothetical protein